MSLAGIMSALTGNFGSAGNAPAPSNEFHPDQAPQPQVSTVQPAGTPPPTQPAVPATQQYPPLGPQSSGIKGYLANIFYYTGEAGKAHLGIPTDAQVRAQQIKQDNETLQANADAFEKKARATYYYQQSQQEAGQPINEQDAVRWGLPVGTLVNPRERANLDKVFLTNRGKTDVANINAVTKKANVDPIKQALNEAKAAADAGDDQTMNAKLALATKLKDATTKPANNEIGLILKANGGDTDAQKALDVLQQRRLQLQTARGAAFGKNRLWALQKVYDPETGDTNFMTGFDILANQQAGKHVIPTGALPQDKVIAVQQLQSEAKPALKQMRDNLVAFDNAADRAIFARVIKNAGNPNRGDEASWMGNVMNQALKEGLSPQGQQLAIADARMAETLGRMRSVLGLQATDSAMAIGLRLMPGASTPNSKYAKDQLDTLDQVIGQAVNIPAFGGKNHSAVPPATPPKNRPPLSSFEGGGG